jgi:hypothetical protein
MQTRNIVGLGIGVVVLLGSLAIYAARSNQIEHERLQQLNYETSQRAEEERNRIARLIRASCRTSIEQAITPNRVLNWITATNPETNTSKDIISFSKTTSGYEMDLAADLGGRYLKTSCYTDEAFRVLRLAEGTW